jgi:acyl carrier protein
MQIVDFLDELTELIEADNALTIETNLQELEEFDSLAVMSIIAYVDDKFDQRLSSADLKAIATVRDLLEKIGEANFS